MPTRTTDRYMTSIDSSSILAEIKSKGLKRTEVAVMLIPYYDCRSDSYHRFKWWMQHNRMPVDKYNELRRILDGTV